MRFPQVFDICYSIINLKNNKQDNKMKVCPFKAATKIKSLLPQGIMTSETSRDPREWKDPRVSVGPSPCFSNKHLHSKGAEGSLGEKWWIHEKVGKPKELLSRKT